MTPEEKPPATPPEVVALRPLVSDIRDHAEAAKEYGQPVDWDLLFRAIEVLEGRVA